MTFDPHARRGPIGMEVRQRLSEMARKRGADLSGKRFGRLTVVELEPWRAGHAQKWICRCDCGDVTKVRTADLKRGSTKSCGCLRSQNSAASAAAIRRNKVG